MALTRLNNRSVSAVTALPSGIDIPTGSILASDLNFTPGKVLQVLQAFRTNSGTFGSSSYVDLSPFTITMTPSSTNSKFLLIANLMLTQYQGTAQVRFTRNDSAIGFADASSSRTQSTVGVFYQNSDQNHQNNPTTAIFLDSPSTTSSVTYKVQGKTQDGGTCFLNRSGNDADNGNWSHRSTSNFIVMEIAS